MGESLSTWTPSCNGSVRVELSGHRTTSDSGALLLREALDSSGVIEALGDNLVDARHPLRIRHSLTSQIRTLVLQRAMGWIDLSDTDMLRRDPLWQLACSDARGVTPLAQERPSQATLSRLLTCLGHNDNIDVVHEGLLRLVLWRLTSLKNGERPKQLTLDIDGLPIEVHGHQGGSAYHGLYGTRIYSPLVASLAETGDMVGGLLREGNAGPAENADTWIPHLVTRLNESTGAQVRVRIDAGFTDNDTLEALEERDIEYLGRLRSHKGLQKLAAPYLKRPRGRPPEQPREWCHDLEYQACLLPGHQPRQVRLAAGEGPGALSQARERRGPHGRGEVGAGCAPVVDGSWCLHGPGCHGPQRGEPTAEPLRVSGPAWPALLAGASDPTGLEPEPAARAGTQGRSHAEAARPAHHRSPRRCG